MKRLLSVIVLLVAMLSLATPVLAQGGDNGGGQVTFGKDLVLNEGDVINDSVVVFGGNLVMAKGSRINGDTVVFGGNGRIDGEINGDVAFIGGGANLGPTARVDGDLSSVGGALTIDKAAYVRGQVIQANDFDGGRAPFPHFGPQVFQWGSSWDGGPNLFGRFFRLISGLVLWFVAAMVVAAIGVAVVIFLPEPVEVVGNTINQAGPASFGLGLLTQIVAAALVVFFAITICLSPVSILLAAAMALAVLYGWIVAGYLLGRRLLKAMQKNGSEPAPVAAAAVGIFAATLLPSELMVLGDIPCLGVLFWLTGAGLWLVIASTGLGAVVLSRFGTQAYTATTRRPSPPALPPTPPTPPAPPTPSAPPDAPAAPEPETPSGPSDAPKAENPPDEGSAS
jgi:hypothetical protein